MRAWSHEIYIIAPLLTEETSEYLDYSSETVHVRGLHHPETRVLPDVRPDFEAKRRSRDLRTQVGSSDEQSFFKQDLRAIESTPSPTFSCLMVSIAPSRSDSFLLSTSSSS